MKNTIQFKTNINCSGCLESIKPHLDSMAGISKWEVDLANLNKILTVEFEGITAHEIVQRGLMAGYKLEPIK